ncbi:MAG: heme o synthase [Actinomycetota bacterium]
MTRFQKLTIANAATTILLFSVGGLVRGSGSGLGCSDWPHCGPGRLLPYPNLQSYIESSHRLMVIVVTALIAATLLVALKKHRRTPRILWPAILALPLVLAQAGIGGVVVLTELDPWWVSVHFALAMALVADVVYLAVMSFLPERPAARRSPFARLAFATALITGALLVVGTFVRASNAGLAFTDWPLMDGRLVPTLGGIATPMFLHRVLAAAALLLVLWMTIRARTMADRSKPLVVLSTLAAILFGTQILIGAANVWTRLAPLWVVLHVAGSVLIWATLVALAAAARTLTPPLGAAATDHASAAAADPPPLRETLTAYLRLTKPRIIVLLLITTIPAMILAADAIPSIWLMLATVAGGTLAAAGANAINCYLDRDIDEIMRRTRGRPLPTHEVSPDAALRFGFLLGAISFFFLSIVVNVLAATLALAALAFYVFVYTLWLKRSTDQNIVIGGAAGAVPVLVGWAAVTGTVEVPALVMFAIIFVWTPPHFWALAMRFKNDYAAAGVPMMPVVRSQRETLRQILLYSVGLFGVTLVLYPVGHMGPLYLVASVALGGMFVYRSLQLWRHYSETAAWKLFRFSISYLGLLFLAVALDALLTG